MDRRQALEPTSGADLRLFSTRILLERYRDGDDAALSVLFERYHPRLLRWAHGHVPVWARDLHDTGDFVQDTLLRGLNRVMAFEHRRTGGFFSYLCKILMNQIRDEFHRRRERIDVETDELPAPGPTTLEQVIDLQRYQRYQRCLERLPTRKREAVVLRVELGFTYKEVRDALGFRTTSAAHMTIRRALEDLVECMHEQE